jgi:hypothetical protein
MTISRTDTFTTSGSKELFRLIIFANRFLSKWHVLFCVIGILLLEACAGCNMKKTYSIGCVNKSGQRLDNITVYYGDQKVAYNGGLAIGGASTGRLYNYQFREKWKCVGLEITKTTLQKSS